MHRGADSQYSGKASCCRGGGSGGGWSGSWGRAACAAACATCGGRGHLWQSDGAERRRPRCRSFTRPLTHSLTCWLVCLLAYLLVCFNLGFLFVRLFSLTTSVCVCVCVCVCANGMTSTHAGLSKVVHHLLDYDEGQGNEVYTQAVARWPQLIGRRFSEAVFMCTAFLTAKHQSVL